MFYNTFFISQRYEHLGKSVCICFIYSVLMHPCLPLTKQRVCEEYKATITMLCISMIYTVFVIIKSFNCLA